MAQYRALIFSDPHIQYPNSRLRDGFADETIDAFAGYDLAICAGDTFDLQYSFHMAVRNFRKGHPGEPLIENMKGEDKLHPELKQALRNAVYEARDHMVSLSQKLAAKNPHSHFLNLGGNHDNITRLVYELEGVEKERSNFHHQQEYFKIGDSLITHGDTVLRKQNLETRETIKPRNYVAHWIENELERRMHNVVQMTWFLFWNQSGLVIPRFAKSMDLQDSLKVHMDDVKHVFFGHVHVTPFCNKEHKGVFYHQAGAAIKHRNCRPLEVVFESDKPIEFLGEEKNIILPDAKIVSVKQVQVPGLSHEFKWTDLICSKAANDAAIAAQSMAR